MPRTTPDVLPAGSVSSVDQPTLDDGDLLLRAWNAADRAALLAAFTDPDITHWHLRRLTTDRHALDWITERQRSWRQETGASWVVTDGTGTVLGQVSLRGLNLAMGVSQVSYWVLPDARGRGVATGALRRLARWALAELGLHRLWLMHSVANTPSCRVATGAGFEPEGTMRQALLHADGWHDMHIHGRVDVGADGQDRAT